LNIKVARKWPQGSGLNKKGANRMQRIVFISPRPATGKTTVMINVGAGLCRQGKRVLLFPRANDGLCYEWLQIPRPAGHPPIFHHDAIGVDIWQDPTPPTNDIGHYDYHLLELGNTDINPEKVNAGGVFICCIDIGSAEVTSVKELDDRLHQWTGGQKNIDLIVPGMAKAGEWENNSRQLFSLVDVLGEERVADFIPYCEAIHDLPLLKQHVWMLPEHYRNRKDAFKRLLDRVEQLEAGL